MGKPNLLIALPTYRDEVHVNFTFSLVNTTRALSDSGMTFQMMHVGSSHITRARNFFASYFLEHPEYTHLLYLDTDMHFPAEAVLKLIAADRRIAGVAYPYRHVELSRRIEQQDSGLSIRDWIAKHAEYTVRVKCNADGQAQVVDGFVEAEHVGTGIMLVKRDALEAVRPFARRFDPPHQYRSLIQSRNFYGFFDPLEEQGAYLSEDLSFCRRARIGGCEIWALLDQTIAHYGTLEVSGQYLAALHLRGNLG
ncbi:hypothetical protein [Paraburkholderia flagellata]|uniref:hypothetical protein n=1 Tax=Paraburkholderia flagellata TaxID=2883241 RepID=UPI001F157456|nr:hypothetical protein [Paraburkholderia flagellata]